MKPTLRRKCAWCGAGMGTVACLPEFAGQTTYGICEQCAAHQEAREVTPDSFAPIGASSCAVSSATARRDGHSFDAGPGAEPSRDGPVARTATPAATAQASTPPVAAAGVEFISVVELAAICGISSYLIETKFRPSEWVITRELRWNGRNMLYAVTALPALVQIFTLAGLYDAALKLECWLERRRQPATEPWYRKGAMA